MRPVSEAASWTERYAAAAMAWDTTPDQFVVAACRALRAGRALVLGAGEGNNAIWLAGRGWDVTAVDIASLAVSRISSRAALMNTRLSAIVADAVSYQPAAGAFDLILASYLPLPTGKLRSLVHHVAPGLAPGGRMLVVGQDASNLDRGYGGPQDPDLLSTPDAVSALMSEAGLQVVRAEVVRREVAVDIGVRYALDHIVEAVRPSD